MFSTIWDLACIIDASAYFRNRELYFVFGSLVEEESLYVFSSDIRERLYIERIPVLLLPVLDDLLSVIVGYDRWRRSSFLFECFDILSQNGR